MNGQQRWGDTRSAGHAGGFSDLGYRGHRRTLETQQPLTRAGGLSPQQWDKMKAGGHQVGRFIARAGGHTSPAFNLRAGGASENFDAIVRQICATPGFTQLADVGARALQSGSPQRLTDWVFEAYDGLQRASFGLLPRVPKSHIAAIWDGLDALLQLCRSRSSGWRPPVLNTLATAIDIVGSPVAAVPLYAASTAVGASGLLVDVVGVAVTGWIGAAMAALVALAEILLATGVPTELRRIAAEIEAELAAGEGGTPTGSVWDQFQWGFDVPTKTPGDYRADDDGGGGGLLAIGGIAGALLLFKLAF